jgi:anthranilate synthase component 1
MNTIKLLTVCRRFLSDMHTPVRLYLQLRDHIPHCLLLESSDYQSKENSFSFICAKPIAEISIKDHLIQYQTPKGRRSEAIPPRTNVSSLLKKFCDQFEFSGADEFQQFNGLFGHTNFDAVQYFEQIAIDHNKKQHDTPDLRYALYQYLIVINHYNNELFLLENIAEGAPCTLDKLEGYFKKGAITTYSFQTEGSQTSNINDQAFKDLVRAGKKHCALGDVFQVVFSRQFQQKYKGDDFNVYRSLRSVNPSPYLYYFDYGSYKIFGSSPEAQLMIKDNKASLMPIAGTYKRSGNASIDKQRAQQLLEDPKENAEHVMLVDLARNDLNRHTSNVAVAAYKEVHYYSHVMHLVSKVEGDIQDDCSIFQVFGDTFPAGTLSGAPKFRALELIQRYENQNRGFYGGSIGFFNPKGQLNQAIIIRSFMSINQCLYFQAGAGIVIDSDEEKELKEVNNKLAALQKALEIATKL